MNCVLYIDDDVDDQEIFLEAVKSINPEIHCYLASDGGEAFNVLNEMPESPDFIFLDLNMPKLDGKEFLEQIRQTEKFSHINVVMYSTSANPEDAAECARLGAIDFITKPSTFKEIYDNIHKFLPALT